MNRRGVAVLPFLLAACGAPPITTRRVADLFVTDGRTRYPLASSLSWDKRGDVLLAHFNPGRRDTTGVPDYVYKPSDQSMQIVRDLAIVGLVPAVVVSRRELWIPRQLPLQTVLVLAYDTDH